MNLNDAQGRGSRSQTNHVSDTNSHNNRVGGRFTESSSTQKLNLQEVQCVPLLEDPQLQLQSKEKHGVKSPFV